MLGFALIFAALQAGVAEANPFDQFDEPWERDWKGDPPEWYFKTSEGVFWVQEDEIERSGQQVTYWLHGEHPETRSIPYRTSLWRVTMDCKGVYWISAWTTFNSKGNPVDNWDGTGERTYVRPGTMYKRLETELCAKR